MAWLKVVARRWKDNSETLTWARSWKEAKSMKALFRNKGYDDVTITKEDR